MLIVDSTGKFNRDVKRLNRKHVNLAPLDSVIALISENTAESQETLRRHHRAHKLAGEWAGAQECHVANAGDWLVVWREIGEKAWLMRTGTHDEVFKGDPPAIPQEEPSSVHTEREGSL